MDALVGHESAVTNSDSVIKASARRSTAIVGKNGLEVEKRFHSKGWRRLGDQRRAKREYRQLQLAFAAGIPVPAPHSVRRIDGSWRFSMARIPNARSLAEALDTNPQTRWGSMPTVPPFSPGGLGTKLGQLLAQLAQLGLRHGDLHLANLLLDSEGKIWLVDFQSARTLDKPTLLAKREDLIALTGALREKTDLAERHTMSRTFFELVGGTLSATPNQEAQNSIDGSLFEIEFAARLARKKSVLRNLGRWSRESGILISTTVDGQPALEVRQKAFAGSTTFTISGEGTERAWQNAARLFEHRLPVLPPSRRILRPKLTAEFEFPDGTRAFSECAEEQEQLPLARRCGELIAEFHDRGLQPRSLDPSDLFVSHTGELLLHPKVCLEELDSRSDAEREGYSIAPTFVAGRALVAAFDAAYRAKLAALDNTSFSSCPHHSDPDGRA